jgi:hypothetical protein
MSILGNSARRYVVTKALGWTNSGTPQQHVGYQRRSDVKKTLEFFKYLIVSWKML